MRYLLLLLAPLALGCGMFAESSKPKASAIEWSVPEGSAAVPTCDCGLDRAEVAAEIQTLTNRVAKLESFHAAAEVKYTKPADTPKPPAAPLPQTSVGQGSPGGGGKQGGACRGLRCRVGGLRGRR